MKLTFYLKEQGYDLIEGPIRNQKPLQLWLKKMTDEAELYYSHINQAFACQVPLNEIKNQALSVNYSHQDSFGFNIGITLLEEILKSLGLGNVEISTNVKSGKSVTISYDNSITKEVAVGEIESYLSDADFCHPNPSLLKNANRNHILIITGVVFAKNLVAEIETDFTLNTDLIIKLNEIADGKLNFTMNSQSNLKMVASGNSYFPIAVKASRIRFQKSTFKGLTLLTDALNIF